MGVGDPGGRRVRSHARDEAQRVDPATKRGAGEPVVVYEFDESLVPGMDAIWNPITIDQNRLVLELGGVSNSVWIK